MDLEKNCIFHAFAICEPPEANYIVLITDNGKQLQESQAHDFGTVRKHLSPFLQNYMFK